MDRTLGKEYDDVPQMVSMGPLNMLVDWTKMTLKSDLRMGDDFIFVPSKLWWVSSSESV